MLKGGRTNVYGSIDENTSDMGELFRKDVTTSVFSGSSGGWT